MSELQPSLSQNVNEDHHNKSILTQATQEDSIFVPYSHQNPYRSKVSFQQSLSSIAHLQPMYNSFVKKTNFSLGKDKICAKKSIGFGTKAVRELRSENGFLKEPTSEIIGYQQVKGLEMGDNKKQANNENQANGASKKVPFMSSTLRFDSEQSWRSQTTKPRFYIQDSFKQNLKKVSHEQDLKSIDSIEQQRRLRFKQLHKYHSQQSISEKVHRHDTFVSKQSKNSGNISPGPSNYDPSSVNDEQIKRKRQKVIENIRLRRINKKQRLQKLHGLMDKENLKPKRPLLSSLESQSNLKHRNVEQGQGKKVKNCCQDASSKLDLKKITKKYLPKVKVNFEKEEFRMSPGLQRGALNYRKSNVNAFSPCFIATANKDLFSSYIPKFNHDLPGPGSYEKWTPKLKNNLKQESKVEEILMGYKNTEP